MSRGPRTRHTHIFVAGSAYIALRRGLRRRRRSERARRYQIANPFRLARFDIVLEPNRPDDTVG